MPNKVCLRDKKKKKVENLRNRNIRILNPPPPPRCIYNPRIKYPKFPYAFHGRIIINLLAK